MILEPQHLTIPLNRIREIYKDALSGFMDKEEIKRVVHQLKEILPHPPFDQVIEATERQRNHCYSNIAKQATNVIEEFKAWVKVFTNKNPSQAVLNTLENADNQLSLEIDPYGLDIQVAHCLLFKAIKRHILDARPECCGIALLEVDGYVKSLLQTPTFTAWEKEYKELQELDSVLESIKKIAEFKENSRDIFSLQIDVIRICSHFIQKLETTKNLALLKIKRIGYIFTQSDKKDPKTARLQFFINEESTLFKMAIAINLRQLLERSYSKLEVEALDSKKFARRSNLADKKAYNRVYDKAEEINLRIFTDFPAYGIIDFIIMDKYLVHVNQAYAHLIKNLSLK